MFGRKKKNQAADDGRNTVPEVEVVLSEEEKTRQEKNADRIEGVIETTREVNGKVEKKAKTFWADFKKFVAKGNIIDLAVALAVSTAFNKMVNTLVANIITPLTSRLLPKGNIAELKWVLEPAVEADEEAGIEAVEEIAVTYGVFLEAVINFLVISLSIYFVLKVFLKVKNTLKRRELEEAARRAKAAEEKKKAEAEAAAERQEQIKNEFIGDVAAQADLLQDIKTIMLRMEKMQADAVNNR